MLGLNYLEFCHADRSRHLDVAVPIDDDVMALVLLLTDRCQGDICAWNDFST